MLDLQKELQELKEKVAELESRIAAEPVAKWQPKGGQYYAECLSSANIFDRETKEQAQRAAVEMRRFNRLLALRDELCGDEVVVDWSSNYSKYQVFFSHGNERWYCAETCYGSIAPHFTSEVTAQKACDMLNSGEVKL